MTPLRRTAAALGALLFFAGAVAARTPAGAAERYGAPPADISARLDRLVAAYPGFLAGHDGVMLYWRDGGAPTPISDGRVDKSWSEFLGRPDIDDMLAQDYPLGPATAPGFRQDPGRVRVEPFFTRIYGDCRERAPRMAAVRWVDGRTLRVTSVNGVAARLDRVARKIEQLPNRLRKFAAPSAGVFNCRVIAGTTRLSAHSFAAAVDINVQFAHYWRWTKAPADNPARPLPFRNSIPLEIVEIFESEGFIWGGRWYHYDTMHFEYRPELLPAGGAAAPASRAAWTPPTPLRRPAAPKAQ